MKRFKKFEQTLRTVGLQNNEVIHNPATFLHNFTESRAITKVNGLIQLSVKLVINRFRCVVPTANKKLRFIKTTELNDNCRKVLEKMLINFWCCNSVL